MKYNVHEIIRIPSAQGFRVWKVTGVVLGALAQEDHYQMKPLDVAVGNNVDGKIAESLVPCVLLDSHSSVERV